MLLLLKQLLGVNTIANAFIWMNLFKCIYLFICTIKFSHPFSRGYLKILIRKSVKQINEQIIKEDNELIRFGKMACISLSTKLNVNNHSESPKLCFRASYKT